MEHPYYTKDFGTMDLSSGRDFNHECDIVEDESIMKQHERGSTAAILTTKYDTLTSSSPYKREAYNESFDGP